VAEWFKAPVLKTGEALQRNACNTKVSAFLRCFWGHNGATPAQNAIRKRVGEVAEWFKAEVLKCGGNAMLTY
jgi:hypothetical protein